MRTYHKSFPGSTLGLLGAAMLGATAVGAVSSAASADMVYDFSYTAPGITASGQFTTSSTPIASGAYAGGYDMLSMSGQRNGVTITGLLGSAPGTKMTNDSTAWDNVFYPMPPNSQYFDSINGIAYATTQTSITSSDSGYIKGVTGYSYNVYSNGTNPVSYSEYQGYVPSTAAGPITTLTTLTVTAAIPETSTLALLATGGAGLLLIGRRRRA